MLSWWGKGDEREEDKERGAFEGGEREQQPFLNLLQYPFPPIVFLLKPSQLTG